MTRRAGIWLVAIPWMLFIISAIGVVVLSVELAFMKLHVAYAGDQVEEFEELRFRSEKATEPTTIADCLGYAVSYYPSGTKQTTGSTLDRVVEGYRATVTREMIKRLRVITGNDFGNDPQVWIDKYARK
ncbi:MAG: hypothetical protein K1X57_06920 [Gemmataceae bacterium]|nr:hypothetical protein [Gemmataceae bacterium]